MIGENLLSILFITSQVLLLFFWFYWGFISLFGYGKVKKIKTHEQQKKFCILIPAHNEQEVIGQLLKNTKRLHYDEDLYDVIVIADNCTDKTKEISIREGVQVIETTSLADEPRGKPHAIKKALAYIGDYEKKYDAIVFFDADNLVSLNYLQEMNDHLIKGDKLIQCYLDSKNPTDNWVSVSYATSYYAVNRAWQLAKSRLGLGNAIGGTGFCVDSSLLRNVGWTASSLTEDLEFQMQCLLKDTPATWSHEARVYDEKPTSLKASCVQRLRWARGHWEVCLKYTPKLFKKAVKDKDFLAFDGIMHLLMPVRILLEPAWLIVEIANRTKLVDWYSPVIPLWIMITVAAMHIISVFYAIIVDTKSSPYKFLGIVYLQIFNFIFIALLIVAFFTRKNMNWNRTEHNRGMEFVDEAVYK